jgi:hypothetical protein
MGPVVDAHLHFLPREAAFLAADELEAIMGVTAERLWFT